MMRFRVLGPLEVWAGGRWAGIGAAKWRAVLAVLLAEPGRVVSADRIADELWGDNPPPGARKQVSGYVLQLRRLIGDPDGRVLVTRPPGYQASVLRTDIDACVFEDLLTAGREALKISDAARARSALGEALALWRGSALADVPLGALSAAAVNRWEELRLTAVELRIEADLACGGATEVIAELHKLTSAHPLRERLWLLLMSALKDSGRSAEALEVYARARRLIADELGADPDPALQQIHRQLLAAAPQTPVVSVQAAVPAVPVTPRQLPAAPTHFTGRSDELGRLTSLLDRCADRGGTVAISAIGGMAGVGKTALALRWAHRVAGRFPDGQLYVNLRGHDPDQPMPAADALAGFLRALGMAGQDIPPGEDEQACGYRSLLAGKKVLVVLDNAGSEEQVRPLLPGTPGCVVVVTSRDSLAGLVARHGATRLELDLLPHVEALGLLRALIGPRVDDDPRAAVELAAQCSRLPLALRVAAELAVVRADVPLAGLVGELADQQRRLDLLNAGGDPRTAVRAVFSWSYRHLEADTARAFRLAALHPGADFDAHGAAAITGLTLEQARTMLDALARAHLLQPAGPGRYGMHDLLRAYARELAARDGDEVRDAALTRLFDHYLYTASIAMDTLHPAEPPRRPRIPPPATPVPPVAGSAAARAWLNAERATLVAVTGHAAVHGWPGHATRLSATLYRYLDTGGHYPEAITIHSHARVAAQRTDDRAAEADAVNHLGGVHDRQSRYQQAADDYRQALALFEQADDRTGQARALGNLGNIRYFQGCYLEAIGLYRQALAIHRETGDQVGTVITLSGLGVSEERRGSYDLAARHHRQALAIAADIGAGNLECSALVNLGSVGLRQGRCRQAVGYLDRALALSREIGDREAEAEALVRTGDLCQRQGHSDEAARHLREALARYRELGGRSGEADTLNSLGEVRLATGQPDHARDEYAAALDLAAQTGDKYQQARAHHGLGQACNAVGDAGGARSHWQQALALFTELGTPEAEHVRAEMAATDHNQHARS